MKLCMSLKAETFINTSSTFGKERKKERKEDRERREKDREKLTVLSQSY